MSQALFGLLGFLFGFFIVVWIEDIRFKRARRKREEEDTDRWNTIFNGLIESHNNHMNELERKYK